MLILVVWVMALLGVLAAALGSRVAMALDITQRMSQGLQESYLALGAISDVLAVLARDSSSTSDGLGEEWATRQEWFTAGSLDDGQVTMRQPLNEDAPGAAAYGLIDEERKLPLNTATEEILERLFLLAGAKPHDALALAQAVEDWRDADHDKRPDGAESFSYLGESPSYDCKDGPFENVEELLLIKGMTPALYARVAPYVTVYGSGQLNLNTAGETALRALGLSDDGVLGLLYYRLGEDNLPETGDDRVLTSEAAITSELSSVLPAEDLNRLARLVKDGLLSVKSDDFHFTVKAEITTTRRPVTVECVLNRTGQIKAWTEL